MKKSIKFLFAAIAVLAVASCAKEQLEAPQAGLRTIGVAFDGDGTKTTLNEYSPVWAEGDTLWLSNGTASEKVGVPAEAVGTKSFKFETALEGTLYIVYPYAAAKGVANGAVTVNVPAIQDGTFGSANICVGKVGAKNNVTLKNVTTVMKFNVVSDLIPVQNVCINAVGTSIAGTCDVTFDDENVTVTPAGTGTGVSIEVNGLGGDYYASVIPGKFGVGTTFTAVSTDLSVETKTSEIAQTVAVNKLVNMGTIGENLQPLSGSGTEGDPYMIKNLGEWLALTYYVNNGADMAGQYVKVGADISGITQPVGYYSTEDIYFKGNVDGDGHTLTVAMDGSNLVASSYVALFGDLGEGASIKNLTVAGTVKGKSCTAGVIGCLNAGATGATIDNVTNAADVTGTTEVGGIIGYCDAAATNVLTISNCNNSGSVTGTDRKIGGIAGLVGGSAYYKIVKNCSNSGTITGAHEVAGICGYSYYATYTDCSNSGNVTSNTFAGNWFYYSSGKYYYNTYGGTGGISGWTQNSSVTNCTNSGDIAGVNKVGGICGSVYWTTVSSCQNDGSISGSYTSQTCVGGITGWLYTRGDHNNNINNGTVTAPLYAGGIVGVAQASNTTSAYAGVRLYNNENYGEVSAASSYAGGILGLSHPGGTTKTNINQFVLVNGCTNNGAVSAPYYVGGIVAYHTHNITSAITYIINCANKGTVTGTRTDKDGGEVTGGIIGGCANSYWGGPQVVNCYNVGDVCYSDATHKAVYTGGIIGRMLSGKIYNAASAGKVSVVSGEPAEGVDARKGAFVGSMEKNSGSQPAVAYSYYLDGVSAAKVGTASALTAASSALMYDTTGQLESEATINGVNYATVIEALNAYAALYPTWNVGGTSNQVKVTLYSWADGPTLVPAN